MKKLAILMIMLVTVCLLSACEPASKSEIIRYAQKEYGKLQLIKVEDVNEDEIIYYFRDNEYGFEYYIKSYVSDILIDGSKFGESENKSSNFNSSYYEYITDNLDSEFEKLEAKYNVDIVTGTRYYDSPDFQELPLAEIYYKDSNVKTAADISEKVKDLYKSYDNRNYWRYSSIYVYDKNEEKIGRYDFKYDMWMTPELENDYFYIEKAKMLNSNAVYTRKKEKLFKDTGLSLDDVRDNMWEHETVGENTVVTYYYFTVDGKEFFLADILVDPACNGRERSGTEWYSNYYRVIEKEK